jgi:hypothetical protein
VRRLIHHRLMELTPTDSFDLQLFWQETRWFLAHALEADRLQVPRRGRPRLPWGLRVAPKHLHHDVVSLRPPGKGAGR